MSAICIIYPYSSNKQSIVIKINKIEIRDTQEVEKISCHTLYKYQKKKKL